MRVSRSSSGSINLLFWGNVVRLLLRVPVATTAQSLDFGLELGYLFLQLYAVATKVWANN